jgi:hypothetical protein
VERSVEDGSSVAAITRRGSRRGALKERRPGWCVGAGATLLAILIWIEASQVSEFYSRVVLHSLTPLTFFLVLLGAYGWSQVTYSLRSAS